MKPYHLAMNIEGMPVMVVGGGQVSLRKVMTLMESDAIVTVVSPAIEPALERMAREGQVRWIAALFDESLLTGLQQPVLLFGTTDDREANLRIHKAALERGIPCNIADVPELCTFTVPAAFSRGDLSIAISTAGRSPALARRIREELQEKYGPHYALMTKILGELRALVLGDGNPSDENRELFLKIVDSDLLSALRNGDRVKAVEILRSILPASIDPGPVVTEAMSNGASLG